MRGVLILIAVAGSVMPVRAVEGIPEWSRVLDGVLQRAKAEAARPDSQPQPSVAVHPTVNEFIRYYQSSGARTWSNSVQRLDGIRPMIERVFEQEGVPEELMWLGLVESGYRHTARSPKNAVGVWQFIPETARRFGLVVNGRHDQRTDTEKATRAAAQYLRFLFDTFGDWNLALAAYNSGEGRVESAIQRAGTRDFWELAERGFLPKETRAYVPAVLAAQMLGSGTTAPTVARAAPGRGRVLDAPFSLSP